MPQGKTIKFGAKLDANRDHRLDLRPSISTFCLFDRLRRLNGLHYCYKPAASFVAGRGGLAIFESSSGVAPFIFHPFILLAFIYRPSGAAESIVVAHSVETRN